MTELSSVLEAALWGIYTFREEFYAYGGADGFNLSLALAIGLTSPGVRDTTIHVTDGHPPLLPLLQHNIDLNARGLSTSTSVVPHHLSWGQPVSPTILAPPDVLLVADCCYLESIVPLLMATMEALMGDDTVCYFCYKKRRRADKDIIRKLRKLFDVEEIKGKWVKDDVFLYEIRKGKSILGVGKMRVGL